MNSHGQNQIHHYRIVFRIIVCVLIFSIGASGAVAADRAFITLASTTSTDQSGLLSYLLPQFARDTKIDVRVVAVGTGQALDIGRRGDADVVLVHDRASEDKFVQDGFAVQRFEVMHNDFILIGPAADPAKLKGQNIITAFESIASTQSRFVSRADKSGTHAAELRLWSQTVPPPTTFKPTWYLETGSGMGAALNTAAGLDAYILSDRATWLSFKNRSRLVLLIQGDKQLMNPYGVMLVNPVKHPHVKAAQGQIFINWLLSSKGQTAIGDFKANGQQAFFPNAQGK